MKTLIVIPARLESTRLPRKMLLRETGRTLIEHTYRAASTSQLADRVVVGADHPDIVSEIEGVGGMAELTDSGHRSGTDRVAEIACRHPEYEIVVNVQGDEPEISGTQIDLAISILKNQPGAQMATLATPIRNWDLVNDPNCVKVVTNRFGQALYFSRSPIPHPRNRPTSLLPDGAPVFLQHVGLYAYRRDFLLQIPSFDRPALETVESLEQLRVLYQGAAIHVGMVSSAPPGIDTRDDYTAFVRRQAKG